MIYRSVILFLLVCLCSVMVAANEPAPRVAMVDMSQCCPHLYWAQGQRQLQRELTPMETDVVRYAQVSTGSDTLRRELKNIAESSGADVVFCLWREGDTGKAALLLWGRSNAARLEMMQFEQIDDESLRTTAVLKIVEAIAAGLLATPEPDEVVPSNEAPKFAPVVSAPPVLPRSTPPTARTKPSERRSVQWGLGVNANGVVSPGGVGPQLGTGLFLRVSPHPLWELKVGGAWVPVAADIKTDGLGADLDTLLIRGFNYYVFKNFTRLQPMLGMGGGAMRIWSRQLATERTASEWTGYAGASLMFKLVLNKWLCMFGGLNGGFLLPRIQVLFDQTVVAQYGTPLVDFQLGIELTSVKSRQQLN